MLYGFDGFYGLRWIYERTRNNTEDTDCDGIGGSTMKDYEKQKSGSPLEWITAWEKSIKKDTYF